MKEKLNTEGCKKMVWDGGFHDYPCSRRAKLDGYCKQHHPDAEKERDKKSHAKWLKETNLRRRERDCINALAGVENPGKAVRDLVEACTKFNHPSCGKVYCICVVPGMYDDSTCPFCRAMADVEKALKPFQDKP